MSFYIISSVIFSMALMDTYTPGQRYNSTTNSFEAYTRVAPSIFGDSTEFNNTWANRNLTVDPGAMLNPIAVVSLVQSYLGLFTDIISNTMLFYILRLFMGDSLAKIVSFILNVMIFIVGARIVTGRIRWD
jgi:hypothetical protein